MGIALALPALVALRVCGLLVPLLLALFCGSALAAHRPVIFIPGTLGSTLVNERGEMVWGSLGATQARFEQLAFPLDPKQDKLRSQDILHNFKLFLGWIKIREYAPITDFLKATVDRGSYFEFPYDWRQSNFDTACDLVRFIAERPSLHQAALADPGITLIMHSMGGLVGRLFVSYEAPPGTAASRETPCPHQYKVALFLPIATPFDGAGQALKSFSDGLGSYWKLVRLDETATARVFFTIPSVYELLPRYANCCKALIGGLPAPVNPLSAQDWDAFRWIATKVPDLDTASFRSFVHGRLEATGRLQAIVASPLPRRTRLFSISGVRQKTSTYVTFSTNGNKWSDARDGDDTVPFLSANAAGLKSWMVPNTHIGLLADRRTHELVKFALDQFGTAGQALLMSDDDVEVPNNLRPFLVTNATLMSDDEGGPRYYVAALVDWDPYLQERTNYKVKLRVENRNGTPASEVRASEIRVAVTTADGRVVRASARAAGAPGHFEIEFRTPRGPTICSLVVALPAGPSPIQTVLEEVFSVLPAT